MLLKSIFISLFVSLLHASSFIAINQLVTADFHWGVVGLLLAGLPATLFFDFLLLTRSLARTRKHLTSFTLIGLLGVCVSVAAVIFEKPIDTKLFAFTLLCFIGWLTYLYWYSFLKRPFNSILQVGNQLPQIVLDSSSGKQIDSNQLLGSPAILLFFRGNWCPLCMAQIKEIVAEYQQLTDLGVQVILISPQPDENTRKLAAKMNVGFIFATDRNNRTARQLNIFAKHGLPMGMQALGYQSDTVLPTVIITDAGGKIVFVDQTDNYRIRPEPATFIKIIKQTCSVA